MFFKLVYRCLWPATSSSNIIYKTHTEQPFGLWIISPSKFIIAPQMHKNVRMSRSTYLASHQPSWRFNHQWQKHLLHANHTPQGVSLKFTRVSVLQEVCEMLDFPPDTCEVMFSNWQGQARILNFQNSESYELNVTVSYLSTSDVPQIFLINFNHSLNWEKLIVNKI